MSVFLSAASTANCSIRMAKRIIKFLDDAVEVAFSLFFTVLIIFFIGQAIYQEVHKTADEKAQFAAVVSEIMSDGFKVTRKDVNDPQGSAYTQLFPSIGRCDFGGFEGVHATTVYRDGKVVDVKDYVFDALVHGEGKYERTDATVTVQNADELVAALKTLDCDE